MPGFRLVLLMCCYALTATVCDGDHDAAKKDDVMNAVVNGGAKRTGDYRARQKPADAGDRYAPKRQTRVVSQSEADAPSLRPTCEATEDVSEETSSSADSAESQASPLRDQAAIDDVPERLDESAVDKAADDSAENPVPLELTLGAITLFDEPFLPPDEESVVQASFESTEPLYSPPSSLQEIESTLAVPPLPAATCGSLIDSQPYCVDERRGWNMPCRGAGIGRERVMLAPFFINNAQPFTHFELQLEQAWGISRPDRSEFFWAAAPTGPGGDASVNVTTLRARLETAVGERVSAIFEAPLRSIDPTNARNTTGLGDLAVGGKVVLVNGRDWLVTQQVLTHVATGPADRGMGRGAATVEPGLLARYRWNDAVYIHGQLRYFIPTSGTNNAQGEVLVWGIGTSFVLHETDAFAILPTFELIGTSFLDGQQSPPVGAAFDVDGETTIELLPGLRFVLGPEGDLGLPELGFSGGVGLGDDGWVDGRLLFSARWNF